MTRKKLKCEYGDCSWEGYVRTICKNKNSNYHRKALCPKHSNKEKVNKKSNRNSYFDYHIKRCEYSEESGVYISEPWRGNVCHIVDKGRHPSVEANLNNYVYLTLEEHTIFDNYLYSLEFEKLEKYFPNSWEIAIERFIKIEEDIKENTRFVRKLKEYVRNIENRDK